MISYYNEIRHTTKRVILKTEFLFFSFLFIFFLSSAHELQIINTKEKTIQSVKQEIEQANFTSDVLPYDFSSMIFLLNEGGYLKDEKHTYFRSVMKMYTNFIKQTPFIDAQHFLLILKELSTILISHVTENQLGILKFQTTQYQNTLYTKLLSSFSGQYDVFKNTPQEFLQDLSNTITEDITKTVAYLDFEQQYVRFLETAYSKLLWDPQNIKESWSSVQEIARLMHDQSEKKIMNDSNNIDDMMWSLVTRYGYFLEMFSEEISAATLKKIKTEIDHNASPLFAYDTKNIHNKRDYLKNILSNAIVQKEVRVS